MDDRENMERGAGEPPTESVDATQPDRSELDTVYQQQQALECDGQTNDGDIVARAKQFVAKKKEAIQAEITAKFANKLTTYEAVKCHLNRSLMACNLGGSTLSPAPDMGTFFSAVDGRMASCELRVSFANKSAISYSFETETMMCLCCHLDYKHRILSTYKSESTASRVAFMLSDQTGPPTLASKCQGLPCIPVIRMECGLLKDLAEEFLGLTSKFKLNPGTIVVISSATQLALGGIGDYVKDLATITGWFNHRFMGEVELVPGPIISVNACNSRELNRGQLELAAWCESAGGAAIMLLETMHMANNITIITNGSGDMEEAETRHYRMPAKLDGAGPLKPWISTGLGAIPGSTKGLSAKQEQEILAKMKMELAAGHGLQIGDIQTERGLSPPACHEAIKRRQFLIVGASNSDRLAAALENKKISIGRITTTNWKPGPAAVVELTEHVTNATALMAPETVIIELLDNLLYLGRNQDGTTTLPKRGTNGIYHIVGELTIAPKEIQYNVYSAIRPLLKAAGNRPLVIVTPFPRYVSAPCCADSEHVTNFRDADYTDKIMSQLAEIRANFKSFLFTDHLRRISVINPAPLMDDRMGAEFWQDPVHPKEGAFEQLATLVLESAERLAGKRKFEELADIRRHEGGDWTGPRRGSREWQGPLGSGNSGNWRGGRGGGRGGRGGHQWPRRGAPDSRRDSY